MPMVLRWSLPTTRFPPLPNERSTMVGPPPPLVPERHYTPEEDRRCYTHHIFLPTPRVFTICPTRRRVTVYYNTTGPMAGRILR